MQCIIIIYYDICRCYIILIRFASDMFPERLLCWWKHWQLRSSTAMLSNKLRSSSWIISRVVGLVISQWVSLPIWRPVCPTHGLMAAIPLWSSKILILGVTHRSPAFVLRLGSPPKPRRQNPNTHGSSGLQPQQTNQRIHSLESGGSSNPQLAKQFCIVQSSTPDYEPHLHHKSGLAKQPTKLVFSSEVNLMKCWNALADQT